MSINLMSTSQVSVINPIGYSQEIKSKNDASISATKDQKYIKKSSSKLNNGNEPSYKDVFEEYKESKLSMPQLLKALNDGKISIEELTSDELIEIGILIFKKPIKSRTSFELEILYRCTKDNNFFKKYDQDTHLRCLKFMSLEHYEENEVIFEMGAPGTTFYVILKGSVGVKRYVPQTKSNEKGELIKENVFTEVRVLYMGDSFGELALMKNSGLRAATIYCKEPCDMAVLDKAHFKEILDKKEQAKLSEEISFLGSIKLFHHCSYFALQQIYLHSSLITYKRGAIVYKENDFAHSMFIVKNGEFKEIKVIEINDDSSNNSSNMSNPKLGGYFKQVTQRKEIEIAILISGEIFGVEGLEKGEKRKSTIKCNSLTGQAYCIPKEHFKSKVLYDPRVSAWINEQIPLRNDFRSMRMKSLKSEAIKNKYIITSPRLPVLNSGQNHEDQKSEDTIGQIKASFCRKFYHVTSPKVNNILSSPSMFSNHLLNVSQSQHRFSISPTTKNHTTENSLNSSPRKVLTSGVRQETDNIVLNSEKISPVDHKTPNNYPDITSKQSLESPTKVQESKISSSSPQDKYDTDITGRIPLFSVMKVGLKKVSTAKNVRNFNNRNKKPENNGIIQNNLGLSNLPIFNLGKIDRNLQNSKIQASENSKTTTTRGNLSQGIYRSNIPNLNIPTQSDYYNTKTDSSPKSSLTKKEIASYNSSDYLDSINSKIKIIDKNSYFKEFNSTKQIIQQNKEKSGKFLYNLAVSMASSKPILRPYLTKPETNDSNAFVNMHVLEKHAKSKTGTYIPNYLEELFEKRKKLIQKNFISIETLIHKQVTGEPEKNSDKKEQIQKKY